MIPAKVPAVGTEAVRCSCRQNQEARDLLAAAGIPPRYGHCTLASFELGGVGGEGSSSLEAAFILARGFAENYPHRDGAGLLFMGPCGVGKTHLAVAILQTLVLERGVAGRFADCRELLKSIQATYDPNTPDSEAGVIAPLLRTPVLVLDDLGVGRSTEWAVETLHYLLNHRFAHQRATILTTNIEDADPARVRLPGGDYEGKRTLGTVIGERLRSRLYEMCHLIRMQGDDFRRHLAL